MPYTPMDQTTVSMSLRARLAGAEFAFLSRLGATRRTPNCERRFFLGFHEYIMVRRPGDKMVNFDQ